MAIRIESNVETPEQITEFLLGKGYEISAEAPAAGAEKTAKDATAVTEVPGDVVPAETGDKSAAAAEPAKETKTQEPVKGDETKPAAEPVKKTEPAAKTDEDGSKGGFKSKVDKLTRQKDLLHDQLEEERGSKVKLQQQLEEVNAKLAALAPPEPAKPAELVRPKRPTMADCEYDADKLETALAKYDLDVEAYTEARVQKVATDAVAEVQAKAKADSDQKALDAEQSAFGDRLRKTASTIDGYQERLEQIPEGAKTIMDNARVVRDYILKKSQDPAHLLNFFMGDFIEGGAEAQRIEGLDEFDQLIEVKALEDKLIREHKKGAGASAQVEETPAKPAKAAEQTTQTATPAKTETKTTEAPGAPIGPRSLGSKVTATRPDTLEKAAEEGPMAYRKERMRQLAANQGGRA